MPQVRRRTLWLVAGALGLALTAWWLSRGSPTVVHAQAGNNQLSVYAKQASYTVPLLDRNGQAYVGLVELLEPLGTVDARADGKKFKLKFTAPNAKPAELQFQDGKDKGKVAGNSIKLPAAFVMDNGRGYVPLSSIGEVLVPIVGGTIRLNGAARRLFLGDAGKRFTLELRPGTPAKLFVTFDAPVNPFIATEPGRIRLTFRRDPVLPSIEQVNYPDSPITGARFTEHDGVGEMEITGTTPLTANFADGGKTIVVSAVTPPPAPPPIQPIQQPPVTGTPSTPSNAQPRGVGVARSLVLIDPSHGGTDNGAAITPELAEKDVVLALARRLVKELESRGIPASLVRNSDIAISLDQRAVTANAARPALYIALHAANTGTGVHVFTSMLAGNQPDTRGFLPWEMAQAGQTDASAAVAASIMSELVTRKIPNLLTTAPLRPMNNVAAPAVAVELAPPSDQVADIAKPAYQTQVAQAIAEGIAAARNRPKEKQP